MGSKAPPPTSSPPSSPHSSPPSSPHSSPAPPSGHQHGRFHLINRTQEAEDAIDVVKERKVPKPLGPLGAVAHIVKGALGAGILSVHMAYPRAGVYMGILLHCWIGAYMGWCLYVLVNSGQILGRRTGVLTMSYPDIGEAAFAASSRPNLRVFAKPFRYAIDTLMIVDLFGCCSCYQLIVAKTLKQLIENTSINSDDPLIPGYPSLRMYIVYLMIPFILVGLIRYLKYLAPFSMAGNVVVIIIVGMTFYYAVTLNQGQALTTGCVLVGQPKDVLLFIGLVNFSVSCTGVLVTVEANMRNPKTFGRIFAVGMTLITFGTCATGSLGYMAFKSNMAAPISNNFPMTPFTTVLRFLIAFMVFVTHALLFYVPFTLLYHYIAIYLKPELHLRFEYVFRVFLTCIVSLIAILVPSISAIMGFLGCFCLSNLSFIFPNVIQLVTIWDRPGLGSMRWRLFRNLFLILLGLVLFFVGSFVSWQPVYAMITKIG